VGCLHLVIYIMGKMLSSPICVLLKTLSNASSGISKDESKQKKVKESVIMQIIGDIVIYY